jgi:hypothetical protein
LFSTYRANKSRTTMNNTNTKNDPQEEESDPKLLNSFSIAGTSNGIVFPADSSLEAVVPAQIIPHQHQQQHQWSEAHQSTQQDIASYLLVNPLIQSSFDVSSNLVSHTLPHRTPFDVTTHQQQGHQHYDTNTMVFAQPNIAQSKTGLELSSSLTASSINNVECSLPANGSEGAAKSLRERNRDHARSSRQRKKQYVHQLQSMIENLHTERNADIRTRTEEAKRAVDIQKTRRRVMVTFLDYHSQYQSDPRKWSTILEESFWLKQPITPFRSFRRNEVENVRHRNLVGTI